MTILSVTLYLLLSTSLLNDDIVIDLFYLSELEIMDIIPPSNTTHISKSRYPNVAAGQFVASFFPQKKEGKESANDYVFVARNNELVIKALDAQIERERAPKPHGQTGVQAETSYVAKAGYVFWSRHSENLKLFSEYKSKVDYSKYEDLITDVYDEIKNREYTEVHITRNVIPLIDAGGKNVNHRGNNHPIISLIIYYNEGSDRLLESVSIFLNNQDAKLHYEHMSKALPEELSKAKKRGEKTNVGLEDIDVSENVVRYRMIRAEKRRHRRQ